MDRAPPHSGGRTRGMTNAGDLWRRRRSSFHFQTPSQLVRPAHTGPYFCPVTLVGTQRGSCVLQVYDSVLSHWNNHQFVNTQIWIMYLTGLQRVIILLFIKHVIYKTSDKSKNCSKFYSNNSANPHLWNGYNVFFWSSSVFFQYYLYNKDNK